MKNYLCCFIFTVPQNKLPNALYKLFLGLKLKATNELLLDEKMTLNDLNDFLGGYFVIAVTRVTELDRKAKYINIIF